MYKMSFSYKGGCGVFYLSFPTFEKAKEYAEQIKDEVKHYPTIWKDEQDGKTALSALTRNHTRIIIFKMEELNEKGRFN